MLPDLQERTTWMRHFGLLFPFMFQRQSMKEDWLVFLHLSSAVQFRCRKSFSVWQLLQFLIHKGKPIMRSAVLLQWKIHWRITLFTVMTLVMVIPIINVVAGKESVMEPQVWLGLHTWLRALVASGLLIKRSFEKLKNLSVQISVWLTEESQCNKLKNLAVTHLTCDDHKGFL